jgi:hypothetical protein
MAKAGPRSKECQKRMVQEGVDGPLGEFGFKRVGKRLTWVRETSQLLHIVNVWTRWGKYYKIRWGIRCEPVTTILWGPQRDPYDVAYSAITANASGDGGTWEVDENTTDEAVTNMASATAQRMREVALWLAGFTTRQDALSWLRQDDDDHRQATVPWSGALRLFIATAFAAVDRDAIACTLIEELQQSFAPLLGGQETREQMGRLMEWVKPLCQEV